MRQMSGRCWLVMLALALTSAGSASACSSGGTGDSKAGGSGKQVVLRMANTSAHLEYTPAIEDFVSRVRQRSGGNIRVQVVDRWGDFAADAEQQVVRAVAAGKVDLGWSGARVFDTLGVTSFQALQAPMLIDSYALETAVLGSELPGQMLPGLDHIGVAGLAVLADGLRKPIAVKQPILGLADWRGITFGTYQSQRQAQVIRSLDATPMAVIGTARGQALKDGKIQAYEMNLFAYQRNVMEHSAPYVSANVNLWPQMDVLLANPDRLAALTTQQREWLRQAAHDAASGSPALANRDAQSLKDLCRAGTRFANASQADLAALREASAPVYASLEQDPQTTTFIQQIRALKQSTPAEAPLVIPAGCTGKAPGQAGGDAGTVPAELNGTYRYVLTKEDARKGGETNPDEYPTVTTPVLKNGHLLGSPGEPGTTYSVDADRITFYVPAWGYSLTFAFSVDGKGNLHLTAVPPMDRGDQFVWSAKVWTKIG
jgi:TRAP-type C4-dicarboxylate transport system substrate-binding protein